MCIFRLIQKNSTFEIGMYTRYLNLGKSVSKPSFVNSILDNDISIEDDEPKRLRWTKTELQNKQEVISLTGSGFGMRIFCINSFSK